MSDVTTKNFTKSSASFGQSSGSGGSASGSFSRPSYSNTANAAAGVPSSDRALYAQAQRMLVGSLMWDSGRIAEVLEIVDEDDIEEPRYALIFSAIAAIARQNETVDTVSVSRALEQRGELNQVGGTAELFRLATQGRNQFSAEASVVILARIVKESSAKAKIALILSETLPQFADDSGVQAVDAVTEMQAELNKKLLDLSDTSTITDFSKGFDAYNQMLIDRKENAERNEGLEGLQGIPSLLPTINKITGGWKPGQLITVGAGTGVGKSVFAINCAVSAAFAKSSVMFFSLEMSREQIEDRIFASTTSIPMHRLKQGALTEDQKSTLSAQMEAMKDWKLVIDTEPNTTVDGIRAKALRQAQSPEGLDFIIVDYLQLITPSGRFSSRQEAVADISRNMKLLAKYLEVPIMVLVQMKRKDEADQTTLPTLDQIRESGAIAQDSDIVLLLHREPAPDDTTPHTLVIIDKHRDGQNKVHVRCHSNLECSLFREVTRVKDVEERLENSEEDEHAAFDDLDLDEFDSHFAGDDILSDEEIGF